MFEKEINQMLVITGKFGPLIQFIIIILIFIALAYIAKKILENYVKKITKVTKTTLDDKIFEIVEKPLYISITLIGIYVGFVVSNYFPNLQKSIHSLFFVIFVFIVTYIISKITTLFIKETLKVQKKYENTPKLINKIISVTVYLIAFMVLLAHFNIDITPLVAGLGVSGLILGMALQTTLSNFFSGLQLIIHQLIKIGDFIELEDDIKGFVDDIGLFSTKIKTLGNSKIIVPNNKLIESIITDHSAPESGGKSVVIQCGVGYGSDLDKVEKVTIQVATEIQKKVPGAVKDFKPFIRYHTFGDSNIDFSIILRVEKPTDKYLVTHEFIKALKKRFDKENIEISWPVRKIYMEK